MSDQPEAGAPTPEPGPESEAPESAPSGPPPPGSGSYGEMLHLQDAVRMIEERRQVSFATDDVERQKLLKNLKRGEFPPPSKPADKLPRIDGGEVDWAECWWAREDIEQWLDGQTSVEKWEQRWNTFSSIKTWRDLPSLASYSARRVVKGEGEWEHWADRYRPRSFTGQFLRFLIWAAIVGFVCFYLLPPLNDQLVESGDEGPKTYKSLYESTTGRVIMPDTQASMAAGGQTVWKYMDVAPEEAAALPAPKPKLDEDGNPVHAKVMQWESRKDKETGEKYYIDSQGEFITREDGTKIAEGAWHWKLAEQGVPSRSFLRFLASPLDGIAPGLTVPIAIFIVLVGVPFLIVTYKFSYGWLSLSYVLTDSRLIVREGLLARHEHQVRVIQIHDMSVHQGLLQVMLGVGDIVVHSDDVDTPELIIQGVRDPRAVKDRIFAVSEAGKQEKRYYIESSSKGQNQPKPAR